MELGDFIINNIELGEHQITEISIGDVVIWTTK